MPDDVARQFHYKLDQKAPIADPLELGNYEGIIFGAPTRFGNMCAQMRNFLDQTGPLWAQNALLGKVGSVFTCTAEPARRAGNDDHVVPRHAPASRHDHRRPAVHGARHPTMSEVTGGTPYGASSITGHGDEARMPSELELGMCRFQGEHVAGIVRDLVAGRAGGKP